MPLSVIIDSLFIFGQKRQTLHDKLAKTKVEAAPVIGGLVHAINSATIATQEQTLAILEQRYFAAKYGQTAQENAPVSNAESTLK